MKVVVEAMVAIIGHPLQCVLINAFWPESKVDSFLVENAILGGNQQVAEGESG